MEVIGRGKTSLGTTRIPTIRPATTTTLVTYVNGDQHLEAEGHDRRSIDLPEAQHALLAELFKLKKPVVLVLINGGAVAVKDPNPGPG